MKLTLWNLSAARNAFDEISNMIASGKAVNIEYDTAKKQKTKSQQGFIFGAIVSQIHAYFQNSGFNVDEEDIMLMLYDKVSAILPDMVKDRSSVCRFSRDYVVTLSKMDRELTSKFIDGLFTVIDTDPLFSGLQMTPDVYMNFLYHLDPEEVRFAETQSFPQHDEEYLEHIRRIPCMICGKQHVSEAHHLKDMELCGLTQKAPDAFAIPLCHNCHLGIAHGTGFKEAIKWLPYDIKTVCKIMYLRWKNGVRTR